MSTSRAIAAVSHLLVEQIKKVLRPEFPDVEKLVTVGPPHIKRQGRNDPQVNLFLYQIATDAAWRNQDLPTNKPGERAYPLLPLRLQYLITTFGSEDDDQQSHDLLGSIMLLLHNEPILPIPSDAAEGSVVAQSGLAQQYEPVRLTFQPLSIDEISKLWSGFQSQYHLSVAYEAAVVLIESQKPRSSAPPVLARGDRDDRGFDATTLAGEPALESAKFAIGLHAVRLDPQVNAAGWLSDELILTGRNLDHPDLRLVFRHPGLTNGYVAQVTDTLQRTSERLRIRVPHHLKVFQERSGKTLSEIEQGATVPATADSWLSGIYTLAGARGVRVRQPDGTEVLDRLYTTPPITFGMMPDLRIPPVAPRFPLTFAVVGGVTKATLSVTLKTKVKTTPIAGAIAQQVKLFAGSLELTGAVTTTDGSTLAWNSADADKLNDDLKNLDPAGLFLRVQIDGIDSALLPPPEVPDGVTRKAPPREFDRNLLVVKQ